MLNRGHTRTGGYDVENTVFLNRNTIDNADCTMSDETRRIVRKARKNKKKLKKLKS